MSSFAVEARLDVVRVDAKGRRLIPFNQQDRLDQMLHSLGSLHVIKCPHCGGAAHTEMMPEEYLLRAVSSYWHCHGCGKLLQNFVAAFDHTVKPSPEAHVG